MMTYQTVVEDEVSPGLDLFGPSISVGLQSEEGGEGVLPGPFHHKAGGLLGSLLEPKQQQIPASIVVTH